MNNRMSYSDVQQLKNHIRQRMQATGAQTNNQGSPYGSQHGMAGRQRQPVPAGRMAQANNRVQQQSQPVQQRGQQVPQAQQRGRKPMNNVQSKGQDKVADNTVPASEKQVTEQPAKPQGGAHFDKYDCGHPYPRMSVRQHLKEDMGKSHNERIDNLRYAYVMSEILSEPVCKRRRRARQTM